jgi:hypothetical protein
MDRHKQIDVFTQEIADKVYYFQSEFGLEPETLAGTLMFAAMDLRDYGVVSFSDELDLDKEKEDDDPNDKM